ncbi:MAG: hypothetical protein K2N94_16315, partial [Lachnospiraceae bacterium]|nr:hypothetical protein [Lachnospiraceae bacterium]
LSVCAAICLAAAALLLRYRATLRYRNRQCSNRRRALELYARMERLVCLEARGDEPRISRRENEGYEAFAARVLAESGIAGESFRACQELALRAAFGGTHITSEELELLAQSASEMQERLFGSSGALRKFYLKFLKIC